MGIKYTGQHEHKRRPISDRLERLFVVAGIPGSAQLSRDQDNCRILRIKAKRLHPLHAFVYLVEEIFGQITESGLMPHWPAVRTQDHIGDRSASVLAHEVTNCLLSALLAHKKWDCSGL